MPDHPTPDLTTLQAVCEAATKGEWFMHHGMVINGFEDDIMNDWTDADLNFVATFHPSLVARLLAVCEALELVLPMAKGYAAEHPVGSNQRYVEVAQESLTALGGR